MLVRDAGALRTKFRGLLGEESTTWRNNNRPVHVDSQPIRPWCPAWVLSTCYHIYVDTPICDQDRVEARVSAFTRDVSTRARGFISRTGAPSRVPGSDCKLLIPFPALGGLLLVEPRPVVTVTLVPETRHLRERAPELKHFDWSQSLPTLDRN